jgi:hypothetical protein
MTYNLALYTDNGQASIVLQGCKDIGELEAAGREHLNVLHLDSASEPVLEPLAEEVSCRFPCLA